MIHNYLDEEIAFIDTGFEQRIETDKKILVSVNNQDYVFPYVTNYMFSIEENDILFSIGKREERIVLFFNRSYDSDYPGYTSPCRTYYKGLINKPFNLCFPFDDEVIIYTEKDEIIRVCLKNEY